MNLDFIDYDKVIKSRYVTARTSYEYAYNNLVPLIDRLDIQRSIQDTRFYDRLEQDLVKGCIMPPITLAFINGDVIDIENPKQLNQFFNDNITQGFILDGIQRLNTLKRAVENRENLDKNRTLYLNILVCSSMDNLLYRMITLNNGQKAMSARHQIEILSSNLFEFDDPESPTLPILTEKEIKGTKIKVAFSKADFIKGYLAFLSNSTNIENQRIIEERLDELIADKILDSGVTEDGLEFSHVISLVDRFCQNIDVFKWFRNSNNLVGFCVGVKHSFDMINKISAEDFANDTRSFETAFRSFNFSKIKVGRIRRNLVSYYFKNYPVTSELEEFDLIDVLSQVD